MSATCRPYRYTCALLRRLRFTAFRVPSPCPSTGLPALRVRAVATSSARLKLSTTIRTMDVPSRVPARARRGAGGAGELSAASPFDRCLSCVARLALTSSLHVTARRLVVEPSALLLNRTACPPSARGRYPLSAAMESAPNGAADPITGARNFVVRLGDSLAKQFRVGGVGLVRVAP